MANKWIDIFALSQFSGGLARLSFGGRTVRIVIANYVDGDKVRVTLANRYGNKGVDVSRVSIAQSDSLGNYISEPILLTFNNEEYGIIKSKSSLTSDDMDYTVKKGYLAISIYFKGKAYISSLNMLREKVIISEKGDFTQEKTIADADRFTEKFLDKVFKIAGVSKCDLLPALESVSVFTDSNKATVLAFGDSITQGGMWTYELAKRMDNPVLNLGISGNRLLRDCGFPVVKGLFGEAAVNRFDRDVVTRNGAKVIIVLLGTNDIGQPGTFCAKKKEMVTSEEVIAGLKNIALRAKRAGLITYVCTLTPHKFFRMGYIGDAVKVRHEVNEWIRNNDVYDGYYDFEDMIKDSEDSEKIAKPYDSGDHLHPSDEGSIKMLDAIDINKLNKIIEGKV